MRLSHRVALAIVTVALVLGSGSGLGRVQAQAQRSVDDEADGPVDDPAAAGAKEGIEGGDFDDYETAEQKRQAKDEVYWGFGARARTIYVPRTFFELFFVDKASGGVFQFGYGFELVRRKRNFELVFGIEYENVSPDDGFWLAKGADPNIPAQAPDYEQFNDLAWVSGDISFLYNAPLDSHFSFRYGAGFGLGVVRGEILQTDSVCQPGANADNIEQTCMADPNGNQVNDPADLPPVFPVVQVLVGLQFRPFEHWTFNLDAGIRTLAFFGLSSTVYF